MQTTLFILLNGAGNIQFLQNCMFSILNKVSFSCYISIVYAGFYMNLRVLNMLNMTKN